MPTLLLVGHMFLFGQHFPMFNLINLGLNQISSSFELFNFFLKNCLFANHVFVILLIWVTEMKYVGK